jgi:hypothetical protein
VLGGLLRDPVQIDLPVAVRRGLRRGRGGRCDGRRRGLGGARSLGAAAYLVKPVPLARLVDAVVAAAGR